MDGNDDFEEIRRVIHEVRSPLTILSARTQLLHRRIEQGWVQDPTTCLGSLESMHLAAQELQARLHDLEQIVNECEARRNTVEPPHDI